MLIELDLDEAKRLKLTINQFLLIKLVLDNVKADSYQNVIHLSSGDIKELIDKNIFTKSSLYDGTFKHIELTEDFKSKFITRDFFDEFYSIYPISVTRTDGSKDYLRADVYRCRKAYNSLVGKSASKHEEIVAALKHELQNRRINGSMQYMKRMYKWLTSEEYQTYSEAQNENSVISSTPITAYGTDVI